MAAEEQSDKIEAFVKQVEKWEIPEGDELLNNLKEMLRSDLNRYVELFLQCKSMELLKSPQELSEKISSLPESCFFYIGYTKAIEDSTYLWTTCPKSENWEQQCGGAGQAPVKIHTYFTKLDGTLTEDAFIKKWKKEKQEQCLNGTFHGEKRETGIVYVLVYKCVDPREDVNRLCQKLKEGDLSGSSI